MPATVGGMDMDNLTPGWVQVLWSTEVSTEQQALGLQELIAKLDYSLICFGQRPKVRVHLTIHVRSGRKLDILYSLAMKCFLCQISLCVSKECESIRAPETYSEFNLGRRLCLLTSRHSTAAVASTYAPAWLELGVRVDREQFSTFARQCFLH